MSLRATVLAAISCRRTNSVFGQRRLSRRTPKSPREHCRAIPKDAQKPSFGTRGREGFWTVCLGMSIVFCNKFSDEQSGEEVKRRSRSTLLELGQLARRWEPAFRFIRGSSLERQRDCQLERVNPRNRLADDQSVDVVRTLVGLHRLEVCHVAEDRVFVRHPVRAQNVA